MTNKDFKVKHGLEVNGNAFIANSISSVDSIQLDLANAIVDLTMGQISWNEDANTVSVGLGVSSLELGQEEHVYIKNQSGNTIGKGNTVMFSGTIGNSSRLLGAKAVMDGTFPSSYFIGIAKHDIANGEDGYITTFGKIDKVNTSMFSEGDILYANPTVAGGLSNVAPIAPNNYVTVAAVVNADANNGVLFVRPTYEGSIADKEDVYINGITNNSVLVWSSANSRFEASAANAHVHLADDIIAGDITPRIPWANTNAEAFGNYLGIGGYGSDLVLASGEARGTFEANNPVGTRDTETLWLLSDQSVRVVTGLQNTWSARVDAVTISNTGNVGIGTTSPATKLHIEDSSADLQLRLRNTLANSATNTIEFYHKDTSDQDVVGYIRSSWWNDPGMSFKTPRNSTTRGFAWRDAADIERMRLTWDGKLGIGTNAPASLLHLQSTTSTLSITSTTTTGTTLGNKGNRVLLLSDSSTVGNGGEIVWASTDADTDRWAAISGHITGNSVNGSAGDITFATKTAVADTALSERVRITAAGNVGIGNTNPTQKLDVSGKIAIGDATNKATVQYSTDTARTYTIPDAGANANFVMTAGTQTISGTKTFSGLAYTGVINGNNNISKDKIRVWNSDLYTIGMYSPISFGAINSEYAMTFQMNNQTSRGFWWGHNEHSDSQGAMSLSTDGKLSVANSLRVGYGTSDTTIPGANQTLDIGGSLLQTGTTAYSSINGLVRTYSGGFNTSLNNELVEIATIVAGNSFRNIQVIGTINASNAALYCDLNFNLSIRTDTLPDKTITVTREKLSDGSNIELLIYNDTTTDLVHICVNSPSFILNLNYKFDVYLRAVFNTTVVTVRNAKTVFDPTGKTLVPLSSVAVSEFSRDLNVSNGDRKIFNVSNNSLALGTNNTERLRINNIGRVGLGTSSPASKLHILQDDQFGLRFERPFHDTMEISQIGSARLSFVNISQGNREELTIAKTSGNVGIGTTNPIQKLDVNGNIILSGAATEERKIEIGSGRTGDGAAFIDFVGDTTYTDYGLRINRAGGANSTSTIEQRGTGPLILRTREAAYLGIQTSNTERIRISANGYIGVGTTSPSALLDVAGNANIQGNLTVTGNLTISGTTTTINTETLNIADNIIALNSNYTGSTPTENAGIEINRGTLANAILQWNEASDYWEIASGGTTGRILTTGDEGSGSGLDADTVDGLQASQFLRNDVDGTINGNITMSPGKNITYTDKNNTYPTNAGKFEWDLNNDYASIGAEQSGSDLIDLKFTIKDNATTSTDRFFFHIDDFQGSAFDTYPAIFTGTVNYLMMGDNGSGGPNLSAARITIPKTGNVLLDGNRILTTADEGSGNGLDADTVDGLQASQFLRSDTSDTTSGNITIASNEPGLYFSETDTTTSGRILVNSGDLYIQAGAEGSGGAGSSGDIRFSGYFNQNINAFTVRTGGVDNAIWHAGNDGAGSGLDADTVDGLQASQFLRSDTSDTMTGSLTVSNGAVITDEVRTNNGNYLVLNAGESHTVATGQTGERVYLNAEGGVEIVSSPDNWASGWAGRNTTIINGADGGSVFPGRLNVSGDVEIADKLTHIGDTDTAVRFPTGDTVTIETAGTERFRVTSAGRVGIGTNTPTDKLTVADSIGITGSSYPSLNIRSFSDGLQPTILGAAYRGTETSPLAIANGYRLLDIQGRGHNGNTAPYTTSHISISATEDFTTTAMGSKLSFSTVANGNTSGAVRMTVNHDCNVGIGTTTPNRRLHINEDVNGEASIRLSNPNTGTGAVSIIRLNNDSGTNSQGLIFLNGANRVGDGDANTMTIRNNIGDLRLQATGSVGMHVKATTGNVGIGTTAPDAKLEVIGSSGLLVVSDSKGTGSLQRSTRIVGRSWADNLSTLIFSNSLNSTTNIISYGGGTTAGEPATYHAFMTGPAGSLNAGSERVRINDAGVGIGTNNPADRLHVSGGNARIDGQLYLTGASTENRNIEIGFGRTGNGASFVDFIGDTTYTDFGTRIIRGSGGANSDSSIIHRGTGLLELSTTDAGAIRFRTTNTERMRITAAGNVGIGTTVPGTKLHVQNGSTGYAWTPNSRTAAIIEGNSSVGTVLSIISPATGYSGIFFGRPEGEASGQLQYDHVTNAYRFLTAGGERVRITSNGNVGIGTSTPSQLLTLSSDFSSSPTGNIRLAKTGTNTAGGGSYIQFDTSTSASDNNLCARIEGIRSSANNGSSELIFKTTHTPSSSQSVERVRITSVGNVGIGTSTPAAKLTVGGSPTVGVPAIDVSPYAASVGNTSDIVLSPNGVVAASTSINHVVGSSGHIAWHTGASTPQGGISGATERMRINSSGNIGLGTTTPSTRLDVHATGANGINLGVDSSNSGLSGRLFFTNGTTGKSTAIFNISNNLGFYTSATPNSSSGTQRMIITDAGNVGIGTSSPAYKLEVNGSFAATTKSFVIDHPTKPDHKLRYGSLEGPENGVYVRGKLVNSNVIELPDYWAGLVDEDSITVQLTALGSKQELWVADIKDNKIYVEGVVGKPIKCFYFVQAERKDVDKLVVEFEEENND